MSRGPDAATLLVRTLEAAARRAGCPARIVDADWTRWASATFTGARHSVTLAAPASPALDAWLATLAEAELPVKGHLLADLAVAARRQIGDEVEVRLEALTVEE